MVFGPRCLGMLVGLFLVLSTAGQADTIDDLAFYTEIYPPLNYEENGRTVGIAPDVLAEMLRRIGSKKSRADIMVLPWARAYIKVLQEKNAVLFSTVRTKAREILFKWVGPIAPASVSVIARKDLGASVRTAEDFGNYVVGVIDQDVAHIALLAIGARPKLIYDVESPENAIPMLERGRIQMWAAGTAEAFWLIKHQGFKPSDYEEVYNLVDSDYYFAINRDTDGQLIEILQTAFNEIRRDGTLSKIIDRYLLDLPQKPFGAPAVDHKDPR